MFMNICIAICLFILPCHFPRLGLLQCCLNKNKFHVLALYPTPLYITVYACNIDCYKSCYFSAHAVVPTYERSDDVILFISEATLVP